ncbi:SRPBCC family protein [Tessaracoccus sp. MC1627]|uniref:SRPBCC family protein n=1 Tax=Tessaracoccus sp. MC1627 TaxID=2760312 RepID=UPI001602FBE1|nr:SRPBCC family protein [Tessaracoccus sp. MC1627]MBB1511318.1 SRPBCC family protein [Tessaracoccus sp. MC1627]
MIRAHFTVELPAACPSDQALRRLLDLRAHDRLIPLTRVTLAVSADELTVGSRFVGRTGVGRFGFDDHMRIEALTFAPDAAATIVKRGRVIRGVVQVTARPSAGGSAVRWEQSVHLPWLPELLQPTAARVLRAGYRRVLVRLLAG